MSLTTYEAERLTGHHTVKGYYTLCCRRISH